MSARYASLIFLKNFKYNHKHLDFAPLNTSVFTSKI